MTSIATEGTIDAIPVARATVGVVAEDRTARARISRVLSAQPQLSVRTGPSPWPLLSQDRHCQLLVLHCSGIAADELRLLTEVRREFTEVLIVAVCESANARHARRAIDCGVDGLVFIEQLEAALPPTVAAVLAEQTVVPRELRASSRRASLSFREKQILGMVVMGFTNSEIAARLFLAESTVKSHLSSAFRKLGVRSRNEAAAMILDPNGSLGTGILAITGDLKSS